MSNSEQGNGNKTIEYKSDRIRQRILEVLEEEAGIPNASKIEPENPPEVDMNDNQVSSNYAAALKALTDIHTTQIVTTALAKLFSLYSEEERTIGTLSKEIEGQYDLTQSTMKHSLESYLHRTTEENKAGQSDDTDPSMWN